MKSVSVIQPGQTLICSTVEACGGDAALEHRAVGTFPDEPSPNGDAAIATYQVEVHTEYPGNRLSSQQAHETDVWFKTADGWRISHVHYTSSNADE